MLNCYENKPDNKPPHPRGSTTINIKRKCTSMREVRASGPIIRSLASKINIKREDSTNNATTNVSTNVNDHPHPTQPLNGDGYRKFLKDRISTLQKDSKSKSPKNTPLLNEKPRERGIIVKSTYKYEHCWA